MLSVWER